MDPYRTAPRPQSSRSNTPAGALVVLILAAWVILGTGAPIGKDFLLWAFTTALVVVIVGLWQRGRK